MQRSILLLQDKMFKIGGIKKLALFDYESAGPGISKHAPKKTGIRLFFDIFFRKFWKLMEVNLLYFLFFIPLMLIIGVISVFSNYQLILILSGLLLLLFAVTIGPATAGMTKIMRCYITGKHTFIIRDFFRAFKNNFKKAALVGFLDCLVIASVVASLKVYPWIAELYNAKIMYLPMTIALSVALVILMMNYYIFLMITATNLSLKNLIKNSFALAFVAMKSNIIILAITIAIIAGMFLIFNYAFPIFMLLLPFFPAAFLCFVTCFNSYPVIQKYVINPYYTSIGEINPELAEESDEEVIFEDMGGKEKPIEKRQKTKGKRIS